MIKLSDYVVQFLVNNGISDTFLVSGGGIMHLLDSVGRNPAMRYWCNYHEQACAVAAEGYARIKKKPAAVLVTVGPGAVNAIAGVVGAWYDSLPMVVLCGQVRRDLIADYSKIRQFGPQEGNVIPMVTPVTKYAKTVMDPQTVRYELERAYDAATTGRPGPVWLEFPLDVQGSMIDETTLAGYERPAPPPGAEERLAGDVRRVIAELKSAKRPLFVAGNGVHVADADEELAQLLERFPVPVVVPYTSKDVVAEDNPRYMGVFGTAGQRRANFAVQNCDCLVSLAGGMCMSKTGFNFKGFAPKARKIFIDVDEGQLHHQALKPDVPVQADLKAFLAEFFRQADAASLRLAPSPKWLEACETWKKRYPIIVEDFLKDQSHVNSYVFMDRLSDRLTADDVVVAGNGLDTVTQYQAFKVKPGQRTMTSGNWGSMGWDLPLSVGACVASGRRRTVCVTGDGSFQWNVQELLTMQYYKLPVKVFVFNNQGYSSIRATQNALFEGRLFGADASSGVGNPDFEKLAGAYGFHYSRIADHAGLDGGLAAALSSEGPAICEVNLAPDQGISPKASAFKRADGTLESRPLEDMAPFLPREEVWENMHLFDEP